MALHIVPEFSQSLSWNKSLQVDFLIRFMPLDAGVKKQFAYPMSLIVVWIDCHRPISLPWLLEASFAPPLLQVVIDLGIICPSHYLLNDNLSKSLLVKLNLRFVGWGSPAFCGAGGWFNGEINLNPQKTPLFSIVF